MGSQLPNERTCLGCGMPAPIDALAQGWLILQIRLGPDGTERHAIYFSCGCIDANALKSMALDIFNGKVQLAT